MTGRTLIVARKRKGAWLVVREVVTATVTSVHPTQAAALNGAREELRVTGGGVVRVRGRDGRVRMRRRVGAEASGTVASPAR